MIKKMIRRSIVGTALLAVFYATPVLYSSALFEGSIIRDLVRLNPMATIIDCYRDVLFYQSMPHIKSLIIVLICSIILTWIGLKIFKKLERGFAEEI